MPTYVFGAEFDVNEEIQGGQFEPQVMLLSDGRLLTFWFGEDPDIDGSFQGVAARIGTVQADGSVLWTAAGDVGLATNTASYQQRPRALELPDGRILFTWQSANTSGDGSGWGIAARIGTPQADGTISWAAAGEFGVNVSTGFNQFSPQVTELPDGRVLFIWTSYAGTDGSSAGISGRVGTVQANGSISWATAGEFVVNEETSGIQASDAPIVVLSDGRVLVVWNSDDADVDGSGTGVAGRIGTVQADGSITWGAAGEFTLSEEGQNTQEVPRAIELSDGRVLFVWSSGDPDVDGNGTGIAARIGTVQADGSIAWATAGEFTVNEEVQNLQSSPVVVQLSDGRLLFLWSSTDPDADGSGYAAVGRIGVAQADGSIVWEASGEFTINFESQLDQGSATAVELPDGRVVITWQSQDPDVDGNGYAIAGRVVLFNTPPTVEDDAFAVGEYGVISGGNLFADNGDGADAAVDGDPLVIAEVNGSGANVGVQITLVSGALLTVNANGTFDYDPNGAFEALGPGATTTDSFTYTVDDGFTGGTDTATVTITITGNSPPLAQDDAVAVGENGTTSGSVFSDNGAGADGDVDGDAITVSAVNGSGGNVGLQITLASGALLTVNANGTYDYNRNGQFEVLGVGDTATDSFTYTVSDGFGGTDTATFTITVNGANDAIALGDEIDINEEVSGGQFEPRSIQLSDGRILITWFGEDPDIDPSVQGVAARVGTVQADGTIAWTAAGDVGVAVNTANFQQRPNVIELADGRVLFTWQGNATPGDSSGWGIAARIGTVQADGTISWATAGEFRVNVNTSADQYSPQLVQLPDGRVLFTWTSYAGTDGSSASISGRVGTVQADGAISWAAAGEFVINQQTSGIQAGDGPILLMSDGRVLVTWGSDDPDVDGSSTGVAGRIGTVQPDGSVVWGAEFTLSQQGQGAQEYPRVIELPDGRLLFVWNGPDPDVDGSGHGVSARIGTPQPDGSIAWASGGEFTVNEEVQSDQRSANIVVLSDGRVLFTWGSTDPDVDGSGYGVSGRVGSVQADGTIVWDPAGEFTVNIESQNDQGTPYALVLDDGRVLLTWQGNDPDQDGSSYAITGRVMLFNAAPGARADAASTDEETPTNGNVFDDNGDGADSDSDGDAFTLTTVNGSALNVGVQITLASGALLTVEADGDFSYDPNGAFEDLAVGEDGSDSFTYTITDAFGAISTGTVTLTVAGANDDPAAFADMFGVDEDATINGGNLFADNGAGADSDVDGDAFTVSAVNGLALNVGVQIILASGALLTVNANGTFDYDPNGAVSPLFGDSEIDTFTYTIDDGFGGVDTASVTITVNNAGQSIPGTPAPDISNGTASGDLMTGAVAADTLSGMGGRDQIFGGVGNDTLNGGAGGDVIDGGLDIDRLNGGDGDDTLFGRSSADTLNGDGDDDTLYGGDGNDTMNGGDGDDVIDGLNNDDTGSGGFGDDTLFGRQHNDTLSGDAGEDTLFGGDGDDDLFGGADNDLLDGGNGADLVNGGGGDDDGYGRQGNDELNGEAGNDELFGGDGDDQLHGGADDDSLDGGNGIDTMNGGDGADTLYGRNGVDTLDGGLGADTLSGGNDADTYVFSSALGGGNIDAILFYSIAQDTIQLDVDVFTAIGLGTLAANAFVIGAAATTADHRIIYDATTGALYYDADGDGAGAAIQFATLGAGLALTHADFVGGP